MSSLFSDNGRKTSGKDKPRLFLEILVLGVIVFLLYAPSLSLGRLVDDLVILEKSEKLPLPIFLVEGLKVDRTDVGDFWWIQQDTLFHYFRPLLLFSFWLPQQLVNNADYLQHLINLLLHFFTTVLILILGKHLFKDKRAAFLAALLFAASVHHILAVQWIAARKEILTGLLLILAFYFHYKKRWLWASLVFAGALLSGEHAVLFPLLVLIWYLLDRKGQKKGLDSISHQRLVWRPWLIYAGILCGYLGIRFFVLAGFPFPITPYFQAPFQNQFLVHAILKIGGFFFSLTCSVPFVSRWIIWEWLNHPILMGMCLLVTAGIITFFIAVAGRRRLCVTLFSLSVLSFIPFIFLEGLPFYLYSPFIFFSLGVGAALSRDASAQQPKSTQKYLYPVVLVIIFLNLGAGLIFNWSSMGDFLKVPPSLINKLSKIVEDKAKNRPVFFVDMPNSLPVPFFHFNNTFSAKTGRERDLMAIISAKRDNTSGNLSEIKRLGPASFLVTRTERPFFDTALRNLGWSFPVGLIKEGNTFSRPFYRVTIAGVPDEKRNRSRAQRFFSQEGGITSLRIDVDKSYPPALVIGFNGREPRIILDMQDEPNKLMVQISSDRMGVDYLLRRLADKDGAPPRSVERPETLIPGAGPKPGVGPLFTKMSRKDPVFRRAYFSFLRYLDRLNSELARLSGGPFSMQAAMYGSEDYARSIESIGGNSDVNITSNSLGVSWDSIMDKARDFAGSSLAEEKLDLTARERNELINLLALAQLAALSNRVIPQDYLAEWEKSHPDRLKPPPNPPPGVLVRLWKGICESIPWMYHAGALPWIEFPADNPHQAYDIFHFFSHAWIVHYNLYRERYFMGANISREIIDNELRASKRTSLAHEVLTFVAKQGFLEQTPVEYLPDRLQAISRYLYLQGIPVLEALRDIKVGNQGAVYGAALAITGERLKPSDTAVHSRIINTLKPFR